MAPRIKAWRERRQAVRTPRPLLRRAGVRNGSKRGPKTLLTRSPDQTSRTWRSSAKPTRHLVPSPVLMVAVRSLMRTMVPTCVCR